MALSNEQTKKLLDLVASSERDASDCDGCFNDLAEFVELELSGSEIPDAMRKVKQHLEQCPCCQDEHRALMDGLKALDD